MNDEPFNDIKKNEHTLRGKIVFSHIYCTV
jgi:hypothetical protein